MKVALIHHDVSAVKNWPGNKTVMKHFGHVPSIQLLYVASILEKLGMELLYIDTIGMGISNFELEKRLKEFQPDLVGISIFTPHFHTARNFISYIKSLLPNTKTILGGVHASIYPKDTLECIPDLDYVCVGEAEMVLPEFVRRWENKESFEGLRGLVWRDGDIIKYAGHPDVKQNLDEVPFPARHLILNERYFSLISNKRNYTVFNSSRGCPFACIFCNDARSIWRPRSPENIADEFEQCYEKYGIREIDIYDSSFTIKKQRVLDICTELIKRGLHKKIIWNARSRVDCIDMEMLEAMKEAGCYRIFYGLESGNTEILKTLCKKANVEQMKDIVQKTHKVGISVFAYFLVGSPGETSETFRQTIDTAKSLPLDFATFSCVIPLPQTQLYEKYYLSYTNRDFWCDYIRSPEPLKEFVGRPWTDLKNEELNKMAYRAFLEFYLRPIQVLRVIKSIGSFKQFFRYGRMGVEMAANFCSSKLMRSQAMSG